MLKIKIKVQNDNDEVIQSINRIETESPYYLANSTQNSLFLNLIVIKLSLNYYYYPVDNSDWIVD